MTRCSQNIKFQFINRDKDNNMGNQLSHVNAVDEKFSAGAPGKKHICVIGAGSSGLVVMKELTKLGHKVTCFESLPAIGGVYVKSYQNTILTTSSLLTAWSDHSDGKEDQPKFWTAEEYIEYMNNFAKKFDLLKNIRFSHDVLTVKKCKDTGKWMVTVKGGRGCSEIERCDTILEDPLAEPYTLSFDGMAICTGTNTFAANLNFPGQDRFKGEMVCLDALLVAPTKPSSHSFPVDCRRTGTLAILPLSGSIRGEACTHNWIG
jgi:Flavin-binding monooxygenase-like